MVINSKESGVSIAMQAMLASLEKESLTVDKNRPGEFSVKIANTLQEREAVFRLGYQIYLEKGYIKENPQELLIQNYDADPETVILMVENQDKGLVASVTLVFDGYLKLPAEKIYASELRDLKQQGEKMVEISRLVINPEFRNSKEVLVLLFNYLAIYSYHVKKYTSLVVEVNPRHKNYYKTLLNFDEIGSEKACPSVQNAPAILLFLPLSRYQSEVIRCSNPIEQNQRERSLYPYFLKPEQETLVAYYLNRQVKPLSQEEKQYFGFSESNNRMAVAI